MAEELDRVTLSLQLTQTDLSAVAASHGLSESALDEPVTPKTPADEGKEYFLSEQRADEKPIRVYELRLAPDGGPNKDRSVSAISVLGFIAVKIKACSISASHQHIPHIFYASLLLQERQPQKTVCSKPIFRWMVVYSSGTRSWSASGFALLTPRPSDLNAPL